MAKYDNTPESFIVAWQLAKTTDEAVILTGLSRRAVSSRASYYRKNGVGLKSMLRGRRRNDWAALAKLANKR